MGVPFPFPLSIAIIINVCFLGALEEAVLDVTLDLKLLSLFQHPFDTDETLVSSRFSCFCQYFSIFLLVTSVWDFIFEHEVLNICIYI